MFLQSRENLWSSFFTQRTSSTFVSCWTEFLTDVVEIDPLPLLFQTISDKYLSILRIIYLNRILMNSDGDYDDVSNAGADPGGLGGT